VGFFRHRKEIAWDQQMSEKMECDETEPQTDDNKKIRDNACDCRAGFIKRLPHAPIMYGHGMTPGGCCESCKHQS